MAVNLLDRPPTTRVLERDDTTLPSPRFAARGGVRTSTAERPRLLVNTDHCGVLNRTSGLLLTAKFNSSLDPKMTAEKLMTEEVNMIIDGKRKMLIPLPRQLAEYWLSINSKSEFTSLEEISQCSLWALSEAGKMEKEVTIHINFELARGITERDAKRAGEEAAGLLTKGAVEYAKWITEIGAYHIIISDSWLHVVEGTVNALRESGARIDFFDANEMIFEDGVFNAKVRRVWDKWKLARETYRTYGFRQVDGVYNFTVSVDDYAANIGGMKMHELPLAFCPTQNDEKKFERAGIQIIRERDLMRAKDAIEKHFFQ